MNASPSARLVLILILFCGLLLAGAAVFLALTMSDPIGPIFRQAPTIPLLLGLVAWNITAWGTRRLVVGRLGKGWLSEGAALIWGGFRIALFVALLAVIVGGAIALIVGLQIGAAFVRAFVLIAIVTVISGIAGGAFLNSLLVVRRLRERPTQ